MDVLCNPNTVAKSHWENPRMEYAGSPGPLGGYQLGWNHLAETEKAKP